MPIRLNHTIVAAHDKENAAKFLAEILGLPAPIMVGPFAVVQVSDDLSLDYIDASGEIASQHYAFLVEENDFDQIFERICKRQLTYWADPGRRESQKINNWDGRRGVYFDDPNGHLLEIITRPYGSGPGRQPRVHIPCSQRKVVLSAPELHVELEGNRYGLGCHLFSRNQCSPVIAC